MNFNKYDALITGQLGDVILGSYVNTQTYSKPHFSKAISSKYQDLVSSDVYNKWDNQELFLMNNRGFNGILTGNLAIQEYTETLSPFMDVDFFKFCYSIHVKERINHRLYFKWMHRFHPESTKYIWEQTGRKIPSPDVRKLIIRGKDVPVTDIFPWLYTKGKNMARSYLFNSSSVLDRKQHMNPFGLWYKENPAIEKIVNGYINEYIDLIDSENIKKIVFEFFFCSYVIEKLQILSLVSCYKIFINANQ